LKESLVVKAFAPVEVVVVIVVATLFVVDIVLMAIGVIAFDFDEFFLVFHVDDGEEVLEMVVVRRKESDPLKLVR
jgi:hypothetical protein